MTGRLIQMMKKWWVLALVLALALSLTSCSNKKREPEQGSTFGLSQCDNPNWALIDVYVRPAPGQPNGIYQVVAVPVQLTNEAFGDVVTIAVANPATEFKVLAEQSTLNVDTPIYAGEITFTELQQYDRVAITAYVPGCGFLDDCAGLSAVCALVPPTDALGQTQF